jgi:hypothetical protein
MSHQRPSSDELRLDKELGFRRPNLTWAKLEILLGLLAVSAGHLLSIYTIVHAGPRYFWLLVAASVVLQSLGGYLALAGHRSHLYQAQNKLAAWVAVQIAKRD